jgi:hypothetical protein
MQRWVVVALALALFWLGGAAPARAETPEGGRGPGQDECVFAGAPVSAGSPAPLIMGSHTSSLWQHPESGYTMYLRFYADGTVIGVSSTGTAAKVNRWFNAPYENTGRYVARRERLQFQVTSPAGRVDYVAIMDGERLQISSCSRINGHRATDFYDRVPEQ